MSLYISCADLHRKRISTYGQRESISTVSTVVTSPILDLLFIAGTDPALSKSTVAVNVQAIFFTNTVPMSTVAIPVSICYVVVNQGSIFILTELADQFRFQC